MYKKIIIGFFLFSSFVANARDEYTSPEKTEEVLVNPCAKIKKQGVLPSARKCIGPYCEDRCFGFIGNLEFLYFLTKEDGFEYVAKNSGYDFSTGISAISLDANTNSFDFSYEPGFRLGMGFYIPRLSWDFSLNWTRIYFKCKNSTSLDVDISGKGLIPLYWNSAAFDNISSPIRFEDSRSKLDFSFDSLEVVMGDSFYTSPYVSLSLHGGLKGAIINQTFYAAYDNGNNIVALNGNDIHLITGLTRIMTDSKGLGPMINLDSIWNICKSDFNILATGSFAFLLTRFNLHLHELDTAFNNNTLEAMSNDFKLHEYVWLLRPVAQLKLGVGWGRCLGCDKNYFLGINATYEIQYFWEQNLSRRLIDREIVGMAYPTKGDLFFNGFALSTHFEF